MTKRAIKLDGYAYQQGDEVEVYLKLPNGKFVKMQGSWKEARRSWGRWTRHISDGERPAAQNG
jgi:hypothetical protein